METSAQGKVHGYTEPDARKRQPGPAQPEALRQQDDRAGWLARARRDAHAAAEAAGVAVRQLSTPDEAMAGAELLDRIWNPDGQGEPPTDPALLIALHHAGNYASGAYEGDRLVGVTMGFFGPPQANTLHSDIAGVAGDMAGRGVGTAMKLNQRAWCLEHGVTVMKWTFDPLITRNARFNLNRLGARLESYLPSFYGEMRDATNAGQGSDRVLVRWRLDDGIGADTADDAVSDDSSRSLHHRRFLQERSQQHWTGQNWPGQHPPERLLLTADGEGNPASGPRGSEAVAAAADVPAVGLSVPGDIPQLRVSRPELSWLWREALHETMHPLMDSGWTVAGITGNTYILTSPTSLGS